MRHPFWQWAGWLSLGLSGCLHGQDWRAAVSKPMTRPVADNRESRPQPKVVGPIRGKPANFVPPPEVAPAPAVIARAPISSQVPAVPPEVALPTRQQPKPVGSESKITPVSHEVRTPQVTAAAVASPSSSNGSFAEFERLIPQAHSVAISHSVSNVAKKLELVEPAEVVIVEHSSESADVLPEIIPARSSVTETPPVPVAPRREVTVAPPREVTVAPPRELELDDVTADDQPRGLFSKPSALAKELPDVNELSDTTANASTEKVEPEFRPRDVSVLVDQVFEDLRRRRMNAARQRTEWLKQLVSKRTAASEPRHIEIDPQAASLATNRSETHATNEETLQRP